MFWLRSLRVGGGRIWLFKEYSSEGARSVRYPSFVFSRNGQMKSQSKTRLCSAYRLEDTVKSSLEEQIFSASCCERPSTGPLEQAPRPTRSVLISIPGNTHPVKSVRAAGPGIVIEFEWKITSL